MEGLTLAQTDAMRNVEMEGILGTMIVMMAMLLMEMGAVPHANLKVGTNAEMETGGTQIPALKSAEMDKT